MYVGSYTRIETYPRKPCNICGRGDDYDYGSSSLNACRGCLDWAAATIRVAMKRALRKVVLLAGGTIAFEERSN
jgi:hypothetical protein